jgi:hypothetical protein
MGFCSPDQWIIKTSSVQFSSITEQRERILFHFSPKCNLKPKRMSSGGPIVLIGVRPTL